MSGRARPKRGDIVAVAASGYAGKPRPCVIVQADEFDATDSVTICLLTSVEADAPLVRVPIEPSEANALKRRSWAMADKVMTIRRAHVGRKIGRLTDAEMAALSRAAIVFLKLA